MTQHANIRQQSWFYSGGMAEFVTQPSDLTYAYVQKWFTGRHCLGQAMRLLQLPCAPLDQSVLVRRDGELLVDLKVQEVTLYADTVFAYQAPTDLDALPKLRVDFSKWLRPKCWRGTWQLLMAQSHWVSQPIRLISSLRAQLEEAATSSSDISDIDDNISSSLLPLVIATGLVSEFFAQCVRDDYREDQLSPIQAYISQEVARQDWFFASITAMRLVKNHQLSLADYLYEYGERADKDYELLCPRWQEIPDVIAERIQKMTVIVLPSDKVNLPSLTPQQHKLIAAAIDSQVLRLQAKKHLLHAFALLRQSLMPQIQALPSTFTAPSTHHTADNKSSPTNGRGIRVSSGTASGQVRHINQQINLSDDDIIGIFPNASPEFAAVFPQCRGLIFQRGGQTSHGAIVAREFGIPAIIDRTAVYIPDGASIHLDADTGEWRLL